MSTFAVKLGLTMSQKPKLGYSFIRSQIKFGMASPIKRESGEIPELFPQL